MVVMGGLCGAVWWRLGGLVVAVGRLFRVWDGGVGDFVGNREARVEGYNLGWVGACRMKDGRTV